MACAADRIRGNHCWSLTVAFAEPLNLSYEGVMMKEPFDGGIAWFANNSSKPGRPEPGKGKGAQTAGWAYRWAEVGTSPTVGQRASAGSSRRRPEWTHTSEPRCHPTTAAKELCDAFLKLVGRSESEVKPVHVKAVIWKFAYPLNPAGDPSDDSKRYLFDPDLGLGACGEWDVGTARRGRVRQWGGARPRRRGAISRASLTRRRRRREKARRDSVGVNVPKVYSQPRSSSRARRELVHVAT